jgi:hypothetical protein
MLAFGGTILLVCVGTRNKMRYANIAKEKNLFFILATPITLHGKNFAIE